jgi:hypothetical protein
MISYKPVLARVDELHTRPELTQLCKGELGDDSIVIQDGPGGRYMRLTWVGGTTYVNRITGQKWQVRAMPEGEC